MTEGTPVEQPSYDPISTKELSKNKMRYQEVAEGEDGTHREFESIYHFLNKEGKKDLVETVIKKAFEEAGVDSVVDAEEFPRRGEKFSDIPESEGPQIFARPVKDGEVLVAVRMNNGEPNTVVMFSTHPGERGDINLNLREGKGLVHTCTEGDLDAASNFLSLSHYSLLGRWMRGKISSDEYKDGFKNMAKMPLSEFHDKRDAVKRDAKETQFKTYRAHHNLNALKNPTYDEEIIGMWEEEDRRREEWEERIERAAEIKENALARFKQGIEELQRLDVEVSEQIRTAVSDATESLKDIRLFRKDE